MNLADANEILRATKRKPGRTMAILLAIAGIWLATVYVSAYVETRAEEHSGRAQTRPAEIVQDEAPAPNKNLAGTPAAELPTTAKPVVAPATSAVSARLPVSLIGGWRKVKGDTEMDTDAGDSVPVVVRSKIQIVGTNQITIEVYFRCEEDGGNETTYEGTRTAPLYTAPKGKRIVRVEPVEHQAQFTATARGESHGFNTINTSKTYWERLSYRVDGKGNRDDRRVGIAGDVRVKIHLEDDR